MKEKNLLPNIRRSERLPENIRWTVPSEKIGTEEKVCENIK